MFVRRKKNRSGTSSVYVVDTGRGRYQVVKSFGVGKTEAELELLEQRADQFIRTATGLSHSLFDEDKLMLTGDFASRLSGNQIREISPELVYGRLYDKIGYGRLQNEMFRHLVIARLFSPESKRMAIDYLQRFIGAHHGINSMYRFLDNLCYRKSEKRVVSGKDIKREVEDISFAYTREVLNGRIDKVFCHLTPLRFEAGDENDLRKTTRPKGKKPPALRYYLGLMTTEDGNPVGYEIFEGSVFQDSALIPSIQQLITRHQFARPVIVADSDQLSKNSINALKEAHQEYIFVTDPKNETEKIRQAIMDLALQDDQTAVISIDRDHLLVVSRSANRAAKDRLNRERGLQRLQQKLKAGKLTRTHINNRGFNKYLILKGKARIIIDRNKCKYDAAWDGITAYVTNTTLSPDDILKHYANFMFIEQSFRMSLSDLKFRPVYRSLQNRIEANGCICFTAYTIMLELERQLKASESAITLKKAQELTRAMYRPIPTKAGKKQILKMEEQQVELCRIVEKFKTQTPF